MDNAKPLEETLEGGDLPDTATAEPLYAVLGAALALIAGGLVLFRRRSMA